MESAIGSCSLVQFLHADFIYLFYLSTKILILQYRDYKIAIKITCQHDNFVFLTEEIDFPFA